MTKSEFLIAYRAGLIVDYDWALDAAKLDRFMASVERTIRTEAKTWNHDSSTVRRIMGAKRPVALKTLRALED